METQRSCRRSCVTVQSNTGRSRLSLCRASICPCRCAWAGTCLVSLELIHFGHERFGVLLHDAVDGGAEELVAAGVIAVRMRIDNRRYGFVGHGLDAIEDGLAPSTELGIHDHYAPVCYKHGGVAATECVGIVRTGTGNDVEIVFDLLDFGGCQRSRRWAGWRTL